MIPKKLQTFLEKNKIKYKALSHKVVYTAFDAASTLKAKLSEIAKTVIVKADSKYILVILPAHHKIDLVKLKKLLSSQAGLKIKKIQIVKEKIITKVLKGKIGAIPPFADLHKIPTYIDRALLKTKSIIANAGTYTDSVKIKAQDLIKAGAKAIGSFGKKK